MGSLRLRGWHTATALARLIPGLGRARNRRVEFVILDPAQSSDTVTQSAATADPGDIRDTGRRRSDGARALAQWRLMSRLRLR